MLSAFFIEEAMTLISYRLKDIELGRYVASMVGSEYTIRALTFEEKELSGIYGSLCNANKYLKEEN